MLSNNDYLNIFHEIKNSITLVGSSLQLVAKKHPEVVDFDYWHEAISEINFLKNMVTQLSSARLCDQLNIMQVNIYSFIQQIMRTIHTFSWNDFTCNVILDEDIPPVELDPQLLKQAIFNIIKNACEAMNHDGVATLHVFCVDDSLKITVTDQGGGLDSALADTIFQPFITSKTGGSGLGLVITKQIIEAHHGTISCESRPGDGCTFTISLPLMQN